MGSRSFIDKVGILGNFVTLRKLETFGKVGIVGMVGSSEKTGYFCIFGNFGSIGNFGHLTNFGKIGIIRTFKKIRKIGDFGNLSFFGNLDKFVKVRDITNRGTIGKVGNLCGNSSKAGKVGILCIFGNTAYQALSSILSVSARSALPVKQAISAISWPPRNLNKLAISAFSPISAK